LDAASVKIATGRASKGPTQIETGVNANAPQSQPEALAETAEAVKEPESPKASETKARTNTGPTRASSTTTSEDLEGKAYCARM
jgi:phage tail sheath protein FI